MKTTLLFALLTLTFMGIFYACTRSEAASATTTAFKVNLTEQPFDAEEVNIDLQEVRVKSTDGSEWTVLQTNSGIYNLSELQDGQAATIASGALNTNEIREIRLVLGTNNSIRIRNVVYPLTVQGSDGQGLRMQLGKELKQGMDSVTVNFAAASSVHQTENGTYMLKPVLKLQ
jgi:hypothetical protein